MWKRCVITIVVIAMILFPVNGTHASSDNGDLIVHITDTGECYHKAGCSYLKSDHSITLREATRRGYRPCSRCKPPTYNSSDNTRQTDYTTNSGRENKPNNTAPYVAVGICVACLGGSVYYYKKASRKKT